MITASETLGEGESKVNFQYWKDSSNKVLSKSTSVTICSVSDVTITAVYGNEAAAEESVSVTGIVRSMNGTKYRMSFTESYSLLSGDTLVQTGFIATSNAEAATEAGFVLDAANVKTYKSTLTTSSGSFTQHVNTTNADLVLYMRAFIQYKDSNNEIHTMYSGIVSASYNSLTDTKTDTD